MTGPLEKACVCRVSARLRKYRDRGVLARPASPRGRYQTSLSLFLEVKEVAQLNISQRFVPALLFLREPCLPGPLPSILRPLRNKYSRPDAALRSRTLDEGSRSSPPPQVEDFCEVLWLEIGA